MERKLKCILWIKGNAIDIWNTMASPVDIASKTYEAQHLLYLLNLQSIGTCIEW